MAKKETARDLLRLLHEVNDLVTQRGPSPRRGRIEDHLDEKLDRIKLIASDAIGWARKEGLE